MQFSNTIMRFASKEPISIIGLGTIYVHGRSKTIEVSKATVSAAIQPATPEVIDRVPQGYKNQEVLTFYIGRIVKEDLTEVKIENGDIIEYQNSRYKIFEMSGWNHIGDYSEASAVKEIT